MVKTNRKRITTNSKTKKNKSQLVGCPIGLKPFEKTLGMQKTGTHIGPQFYKKHHIFVKQLMAKFAPNSIKPNNEFYDYIK